MFSSALVCFEQDSRRQDDKELQRIDTDEIINLLGSNFPGGSSVNTSTGESTGSSMTVKNARAVGSLSPGKPSSFGHVQARVWAGQVKEPCRFI